MRQFLIAAGLGMAGALAGAALWVGARRLTGAEVSIGALAVGFLVGWAVRKGSQGQGGVRYQVLAVLLAYTGFALNYAMDIVPLFLKTVGKSNPPTAWAMGLGLSYLTPIVGASKNLLGLFIQLYALYEAWRLTRRAQLGEPSRGAAAALAGSAAPMS